PDVVAGWVDKLKAQVSQFIDFEGDHLKEGTAALVVNNLDWTQDVDVLTFLRDVGKHFSINAMIQKESVKQRIEREGAGISFTEFTYMILQSYDFSELYRQYECGLQIGGSDQWGNITGGIDLTRRLHGGQTFGLTMPLVTKADGTKFGKTESGTIWLDARKTSPYAFYQFWLSTADADVYKFLRYFTFLPVEEIARIEEEDNAREGRPEAQRILAKEVTSLVHGAEGLAAAERITEALFAGEASALSADDLNQLALDGLPTSTLDLNTAPPTLTQLLSESGMVSSGKQVKDALKNNAVTINGVAVRGEASIAVEACFSPDQALHGRYWIVRLGKKKYHLFTTA
ncbi:MAG: tyrosine--tRNA ligase, partial [Cellvibrionales bacterium]|nr:tyrosine--tRNA ligase [Cellvibrionales bacterium]